MIGISYHSYSLDIIQYLYLPFKIYSLRYNISAFDNLLYCSLLNGGRLLKSWKKVVFIGYGNTQIRMAFGLRFILTEHLTMIMLLSTHRYDIRCRVFSFSFYFLDSHAIYVQMCLLKIKCFRRLRSPWADNL